MVSIEWFRIFAEGELSAAVFRHPQLLFGGSVPEGIKTISDVLQWYCERRHLNGIEALRDISHIYKVPFPST